MSKRFRIKGPIFIAFILLFFVPCPAQAESLYTIGTDGTLRANVLGESNFFVDAGNKLGKKVSGAFIEGVQEIIVTEVEKRANIKLVFEDGQESLETSKNKVSLVDMENDDPQKKLSITKVNGGFDISEQSIAAFFGGEVVVSPSEKKIYLKTREGKKELNLKPGELLAMLFKKNLLTRVPDNGQISLYEDHEGKIFYKLRVSKEIHVFGVSKIIVPLDAEVSAENGEISFPNAPGWLSIVGIFFG